MNVDTKDTEITLSLLQSIAERSDITQRSLAKRLDLALGLTNNYLQCCIKDGLIKIEQIPANRYLYYLTPKGFARKSKLMGGYLASSLRIFREARLECLNFFEYCITQGFSSVAVMGNNDLSDIARLIAKNYKVKLTVFKSFAVIESAIGTHDAWVISDTQKAQKIYDLLSCRVAVERILCFSVLKVQTKAHEVQI